MEMLKPDLCSKRPILLFSLSVPARVSVPNKELISDTDGCDMAIYNSTEDTSKVLDMKQATLSLRQINVNCKLHRHN